jgi:glycosyltransferase involved in cell wall biosynthesis
MCRVPVLVDPSENLPETDRTEGNALRPVLLWCGMVDGYKRDPLFLIDAVAELKSSAGKGSVLRIAGPCTDACRRELIFYAGSKGIPEERIDITGFVSDAQLWAYCRNATALLMPLWGDDRSRTRFPTKLGQYLASRRPIVTAPVGEVSRFLSDETAVFYPPGDAGGLACALDGLLSDAAAAERISFRATDEVLPKVDFRVNAPRISEWFRRVYSGSAPSGNGAHAFESNRT